MGKKFLGLILLYLISSCTPNTEYKNLISDPETYNAVVKNLSDVVVYDIFSPPVASRVYLYPNIAAYQILQKEMPEKYFELEGQINGLEVIPDPDYDEENINYKLAAIHAFIEVGKELIFSEERVVNFQEKLYEKFKKNGLPRKEYNASIS